MPHDSLSRNVDQPHTDPLASTIRDRPCTVDAPHRAGVADSTSEPTSDGCWSLAVIIDRYSCQVVGWATELTLERNVVLRARTHALGQRRPDGGHVHHSDRGSQDTRETSASGAPRPTSPGACAGTGIGGRTQWWGAALPHACERSAAPWLHVGQRHDVQLLTIVRGATIDSGSMRPLTIVAYDRTNRRGWHTTMPRDSVSRNVDQPHHADPSMAGPEEPLALVACLHILSHGIVGQDGK
jgi:hypothetical protein